MGFRLILRIVIIFMIIIDLVHGLLNGSTVERLYSEYQALAWHPEHYCGGAIIDQWSILTAAHCVARAPPWEYVVYVTMGNMPYGPLGVANIEVFPHYVPRFAISRDPLNRLPSYYEGDIAIISLYEPLPLGESLSAVTVSIDRSPAITEFACQFIGWNGRGILNPRDSIPMSFTRMRPISNEECQLRNKTLLDEHFCAINLPGISSTLLDIDTGGALVCYGVLIGVSSMHQRHPEDPAVFTRIWEYQTFIEEARNRYWLCRRRQRKRA